MAKKQPKSGGTKKRKKKYRPLEEKRASEGSTESGSGGGAMQGMVGGFRRAVGVEKSRKGKGDYIWTIALVTIVCGIVFWYLRYN